MAQTRNTTVLKSNRLFSGIYDLNFNFKDKNFLEVKEGDVIYSKGDKSEYMYLLIEGRIKLKTYENPRQPKVFLISKNEFFGEKELLDKTHRYSSAIAEKDTSLFRISYKDFHKLSSAYKKIMLNLPEKKYEEVAAPTRKTELKEDIFQRILNEAEPISKKKNGIELRDYSYENPLLELKAKDEITEAVKMYEDNEDENIINFDETDTLPPDEDTVEEETTEEIINEETLPDETEEAANEEISDNIIEDYLRIRNQVDIFSDTVSSKENKTDEETPPVEKFRFEEIIPDDSFISAVEKLSSGFMKDETDRLIIEACTDLVNAERGILYYPDVNNVLKGTLIEEETEHIAGADTIPGRCLREQCLINIKDVFNDPNFNPSLDYISYFHIHSIICLPINYEGKVKGVLELFNSRDGEFSDKDEQILTRISPIILKAIERWERFSRVEKSEEKNPAQTAVQEEKEIPEVPIKEESETAKASPEEEMESAEVLPEEERKIAEVALEEEKKAELLKEHEKHISLKILMDFLLQEFQTIIGDIKQFNAYLQRIDVPSETKEISDIVTSQTTKIIDLLEALKSYSESKKEIRRDTISYITVFENMVNLLAEYTEGRKVNLYKRFETEANISTDPKFLYLAVAQLIKYQCDLMPFGGNIFISSIKTDTTIDIVLRNATKKTDESLVITPAIEYNESSPRGLGLSLARRIIEDHNAVLEIKSQTGTGLEVILSFPLAE